MGDSKFAHYPERFPFFRSMFGRFLLVLGAWSALTLYKLTPSCHPNYLPANAFFHQQQQQQQQQQSTKVDESLSSACMDEYRRVTADRTKGLTADDLARSRAVTGNRHRLAGLATRLIQQRKPLHIVVCGGSISIGHGVHPPTMRYSGRLKEWLNTYYPLQQDKEQHTVTSMAAHGADICSMAKRMNVLELSSPPDFFILEFAVNDYQGQDHVLHLDHKTDIFFEGFRDLAECAETVVHKLLSDFPDAAVVFLEFQTAILNRKTAQLLHTGVAQHYQVPVISYADTLWPDLFRLFDTLSSSDFSIPKNAEDPSIYPFPHGCAPCKLENIVSGFREHGCKSLCVFAQRSGYYSGRECDVKGDPCYVPFLAHDAVHPSAVGHQIARDLIVEAIMQAHVATACRNEPISPHLIPQHSGWLAAGPNYHDTLRARSDFVLVKDTMQMFGKQDPLVSNDHTEGFQLMSQDKMADRMGWIADKEGESVTFEIDLPVDDCYAVYLSVLKSYATVGSFTVKVTDTIKQTTTQPQTFDCIWKPRISVPADVQITSDEKPECTGKCKVTVTTNADIKDGRIGNKVKIMSLSVRKCIKKESRTKRAIK